jgi:hypothetical protein
MTFIQSPQLDCFTAEGHNPAHCKIHIPYYNYFDDSETALKLQFSIIMPE